LLAVFLVLAMPSCPRRPEPAGGPQLTFAAVGEVRPSLQGEPLFSEGERSRVFDQVAPLLGEREFVLFDFAGAVEFGCQPLAREEVHRWRPEWLVHLFNANLRVVNLANDHALDCGREALLKTMNAMMGQGFYLVGAGRSQREANAPIYLTRHGITISLVSFLLDPPPGLDPCPECTGPSLYNRRAMISALREMRERAGFRVVVLHFKERPLPRLESDELAVVREAIDFGADLVIGYGPGSGGGLYRIRGKWVVAGMGALTGDATDDPEKIVDGLLFCLEFSPAGMMNLRLAPVKLLEGRPSPLRGDEGEAVLEKLVAAGDSEVRNNARIIGDILYLK